jgi:nucleoside-diphosphate kinase
MTIQQTLSIIKPDATKRNLIGRIVSKLESSGLKVIAQKKIQLTELQAKQFYKVHEERPFYNDLVKFMISGPVVVQVLEGENAVIKNRQVMGATNPNEAEEGTIRKEFAESLEANSVHGSDSIENSYQEISFFFSKIELVN